MPGLLDRLWNVLRGKANRLLDRVESPEEQLSVFVADLDQQIRSLQSSVARAVADEKRIKLEIESLGSTGLEWENRAVLALEQGDEDLAKQAITRREDCESQALALQPTWVAQKEATEKLKQSLRAAKSRVEDAKRRYTLMLAEYQTAKTKKQISDTLARDVSESPMVLMDQLSDKIRLLEAESEAQLAMQAESGDVDLESRFRELERSSRSDEALTRLKARVEQRRALGTGEPPADDRVAELKEKLGGK